MCSSDLRSVIWKCFAASSRTARRCSAASASIEELEETAKLQLLLQGFKVRMLSDAQVREVEEAFPS